VHRIVIARSTGEQRQHGACQRRLHVGVRIPAIVNAISRRS
jgi:hypothetical protein